MNKYIEIMAPYIKKTLYPYQMEFIGDDTRWRIVNKSRQIGYSYTIALDAICGVLIRERNQLIVSASKANAEIILDYIREHLDNLGLIAEEDKEGYIELGDKYIRVCSTNWRTARGFNGDVYFDEFAFIVRDKEIWRAMVPSVTAVKGRVSVVSTPKSRIDKFWQIWDNKSNKWSKHCVTIHQAVKEGFPVNIEELRELFDPEEFAQAYECIPLDTAESYIPYNIIEPCIYDPGSESYLALLNNREEYKGRRAFVYGVDIGRSRDETAIVEAFKEDGIVWITGIKSWKKVSFREQKERLERMLEQEETQLMAIDKGGIGMNLHEDLAYKYPSKVRGVQFAPAVKERMAKKVRIMMEEKKMRIPNDPMLISHILSIKRVANRTNNFSYEAESDEHHGDQFWAMALALDWADGNKTLEFRFI